MTKRTATRCAALALGMALLASGCQQQLATDESAPQARTLTSSRGGSPSPAARGPVSTVAAAGDISPTEIAAQRATSNLVLDLDPTRVLVLGDQQYDRGTLAEYRRFYAPTWGRFKRRTLPTPGNHEYFTPDASGYFSYFGRAARPHGRSYYSTDLPGWHLISLNSNIEHNRASAQVDWLRRDLRRSSKRCVLAFWHHPRFSSGHHGGDRTVAPFWRVLYRHRADLVLNGHEHSYERFALQTPKGARHRDGIREFVVGTGGKSQYSFNSRRPHSQRRIADRYGVLRLVLRPRAYRWQFIGVRGRVLDSGGPRRCN